MAKLTAEILNDLLSHRILIKDGAMGTMIQEKDLSEADFRGELLPDHPVPLKGNNDLLALTRPDLLKSIHLEFLDAGADIIGTTTFNSTAISQADYQCEKYVYDMNRAAAAIAKEAAGEITNKNPDKPRLVAGAIGPTNRTCSLSPDVNDPGFRNITFDKLVTAYTEQAEGLIDGGADLLVVETIFDTLNGKAAIYAILDTLERRNIKMPLWISGTITDASGRTLSGQTTEAFWISIAHAEPI